jgi:hypothetical protein
MPAFAIARDFSLHKFQLSELLATAGRLDRETKRQLIQTILSSRTVPVPIKPARRIVLLSPVSIQRVSIVGIKCLWSGNPAVQDPQQVLINMVYVNYGL